MNFKKLGNTGLKVSEIGLGTEYLFRESKKTALDVVNYAIKNKINYIDILFTVRDYLEKIAIAIKGHRSELIITGHIGTKDNNGKPQKTRNLEESKREFLKLLDILNIEYVDILNIQYVTLKDIPQLYNPRGLIELVTSFQEEGKAKFIGISTHNISIAIEAANSGKFNTIMFPINLVNSSLDGRTELLSTCLNRSIGLIAFKPFAGGKLLMRNRTVTFARYQTGGLSIKKKIPRDLTVSECLNYVNSLNGVSLVLAGVKSVEELGENLKYSHLQEKKSDFSSRIEYFREE
jgi:predicted aldo/keto reductase-like oxidoreductase